MDNLGVPEILKELFAPIFKRGKNAYEDDSKLPNRNKDMVMEITISRMNAALKLVTVTKLGGRGEGR